MRGYYRDGQLYKSINRKHKNIFKKRSKNQKEICVNDGRWENCILQAAIYKLLCRQLIIKYQIS